MDFIMQASGAHPTLFYLALFAGIVAAGGPVLVPALYLAAEGVLDLFALFAIALAASACSDLAWYAVGRRVERGTWRPKFLESRLTEAQQLERFYKKHGAAAVFVAKFVYGTRIATQLLAGIYRTNIPAFLGATLTGAAIWFWFLYFLLRSTALGMAGVKNAAIRVEVVLLAVFLALFVIYMLVGKYLKRRWLSA